MIKIKEWSLTRPWMYYSNYICIDIALYLFLKACSPALYEVCRHAPLPHTRFVGSKKLCWALFGDQPKSRFPKTILRLEMTSFSYMHATLYDYVGWFVGQSIHPLVGRIYFWLSILLFQRLQWLITAPAQPHATDVAVYTALSSLNNSKSKSKSKSLLNYCDMAEDAKLLRWP